MLTLQWDTDSRIPTRYVGMQYQRTALINRSQRGQHGFLGSAWETDKRATDRSPLHYLRIPCDYGI
jgi:hypothetical protein